MRIFIPDLWIMLSFASAIKMDCSVEGEVWLVYTEKCDMLPTVKPLYMCKYVKTCKAKNNVCPNQLTWCERIK